MSINFGMKCNSWFDIMGLDNTAPEDTEGIKAAAAKIHTKIKDLEDQGVPHERIILGGFSQGGALSLYAGLTYPRKLAGIIALSCWLPLHKDFPNAMSAANKSTPILQCHGKEDFVVPHVWGRESHEVLLKCVDDVNLKLYAKLAHSASDKELAHVVEFITKCVPS